MIKILEYEFSDKKRTQKAFTHKSFSSENYERLEFLGDSILNFLVADFVFENTNYYEGMLSKIRSHYVSEKNLSYVFDKLNLARYTKIGDSLKEVPSKAKCDIIESLICIIYLEKGLEECKNFIQKNILCDSFELDDLLDYKSKLQEFAQAKKGRAEYTLLNKTGQDNSPTFTIMASALNKSAQGVGKSKNIAMQNAAKKLLIILQNGENNEL